MAGSGRRCVSARQLGLLLWKNSILKRRSYLGTRVPVSSRRGMSLIYRSQLALSSKPGRPAAQSVDLY